MIKGKIIKTREPLSKEIKKIITYLIITLTLIIIVLSVFFIFEIGNSSQKGYLLKQLQLQNDQLMLENEELNAQLMKIMSYPAIGKNPALKNMQEPEAKVFISPKK